MHGLPGYPVAARHLDHRRALEHIQNRAIPLLHNTQLHQHARLPPPRSCDRSEAKQAARAELSLSVAHLPERLSPTYRNRVQNLSPRNRNPDVKHEPEKHTAKA